ncbi:MAG: VOC family protein [Candidatus Hydrogenedentes bacterium]|nr:VOC family protein [Candidatus Hydrogenedentota bacterium]
MQGITPCIWFNNNIEEAVSLYTSLFENSSTGNVMRYGKEAAQATGQQEGAVMTIVFTLAGHEFMGLNGGPHYKLTPAISFFVNCATAEEVDKLWEGLSKDGMALMPLDKYPFSEKFGWCQDKFGVSWQINLGARPQKISPFVMFYDKNHGKAEEAMTFFVSIFEHAKVESAMHWGPDQHDPEGTLMLGIFTLDGYEFRAMDSAYKHEFPLTGAISFFVNCESQAEIDHYWDKLSGSGGKESMCGWLEDRYGISWQIVPAALGKWMENPKTAARVHHAVMQMRKLDYKTLEDAAKSA